MCAPYPYPCICAPGYGAMRHALYALCAMRWYMRTVPARTVRACDVQALGASPRPNMQYVRTYVKVKVALYTPNKRESTEAQQTIHVQQ